MTRAYLGLGANLGDKRKNLREAVRRLAENATLVEVSSLYGSKAMVLEGAPPGPDYLNAAAAIDTELAPSDLLAFVKEIEHAIGRQPSERWAARPIDIDILLYGDDIIQSDDLVVPHVGLAERAFVLAPLAEIAADALHPVLRRAIGEIAEDADLSGLWYVEEPSWADGVF
jgi:2-amino-4-hydroxy-6-hydroxymethyldihydropteridine diphosphokinase